LIVIHTQNCYTHTELLYTHRIVIYTQNCYIHTELLYTHRIVIYTQNCYIHTELLYTHRIVIYTRKTNRLKSNCLWRLFLTIEERGWCFGVFLHTKDGSIVITFVHHWYKDQAFRSNFVSFPLFLKWGLFKWNHFGDCSDRNRRE
jgi:hypothetical protein